MNPKANAAEFAQAMQDFATTRGGLSRRRLRAAHKASRKHLDITSPKFILPSCFLMPYAFSVLKWAAGVAWYV